MGKLKQYLQDKQYSYDGDLLADLEQKRFFNQKVIGLFLSISEWLHDEISDKSIVFERIYHDNLLLEQTEAMKFRLKAGQYFAEFTNDPTPVNGGLGSVWIKGTYGHFSILTLKKDGIFYSHCQKEKMVKPLSEDVFCEILKLHI